MGVVGNSAHETCVSAKVHKGVIFYDAGQVAMQWAAISGERGIVMSDVQYFSVFEASERLAGLHKQFAENMVSQPSVSHAPLLVELLSQFLTECLDAFFLRPVESFGLNGTGKKVVTGGVSAINKTLDFAIKKIVTKLGNEDLATISAHIESLIQRPADDVDSSVWVAVPLSNDLHTALVSSIAKGREQGGRSAAEPFSEALCELVNVSLKHYMEIPISSLKMGFLMEKMAWVANDTVKAGAKTVIRKVTPTMGDQEMEYFFQFAESLVREGRLVA
ncbi:Hypothetical protein HDN1F_10670 [gamma proteobacterium HdN1]|nr:Hypothetical protein HDN1F_10670 [gamma proteobacterium HdN1]